MIERLKRAVFTDARDLDPRTVVLVSLAHSTGLLKIPFAARDLRARKNRIGEIIAGDAIGQALEVDVVEWNRAGLPPDESEPVQVLVANRTPVLKFDGQLDREIGRAHV